jgi:hypothetical protein
MEAGRKEFEKVEGNEKKGTDPMCGEEKLLQTFCRSEAEYAYGDETASNK